MMSNMTKEDFVETFAHFMSEHDLNEAYDLHFKELGHMGSADIEDWIRSVLNGTEDVSRYKKHDNACNKLESYQFTKEELDYLINDCKECITECELLLKMDELMIKEKNNVKETLKINKPILSKLQKQKEMLENGR